MFSAEFRASLQARVKPVRKAFPVTLPLGDDPDDVIDPDDRSLADITTTFYITFEVPLALPPPQPNWSFLRDRGNASVSVLLARSVLESVGCYLAVRPSSNALSEANRCRSAGALRRLLREVYSELGLDVAYHLAGILQPPKPAECLQLASNRQSVETVDTLASRFTSQARVVRWFEHWEPVSPPWRSSPPPIGADDGSWCG